MPAYSVFINGRNFLTELDGRLKRLGFYTTREVAADDYAGAEAAAIDSLRASSKLRDMVCNAQDDPPQLFIEKIVPIEAVDASKPVPGFSFYEEGAEGDEDGGD